MYSKRLTRGSITIFQHDYLSEANHHYSRKTENAFGETVLIRTPEFIPDNFNYQSSVADESLFGCQGQEDPAGFFPEGTLCKYFARYDEFVVVFYSMTDYKGITVLEVSEIESLLETIDDNFELHLSGVQGPG